MKEVENQVMKNSNNKKVNKLICKCQMRELKGRNIFQTREKCKCQMRDFKHVHRFHCILIWKELIEYWCKDKYVEEEIFNNVCGILMIC